MEKEDRFCRSCGLAVAAGPEIRGESPGSEANPPVAVRDVPQEVSQLLADSRLLYLYIGMLGLISALCTIVYLVLL